MTKDKFMSCISTAYGYGLQQTSKRIEPKITIFAWCGYSKLPKPYEVAIYAAYKSGVYAKKKQLEMFEKSFERPSNYFKLSGEARWAIDKELGILDWTGEGLTKEDKKRLRKHYK